MQARADWLRVRGERPAKGRGRLRVVLQPTSRYRAGGALLSLARSYKRNEGLGALNPLYQVGGPRSGQLTIKLLF